MGLIHENGKTEAWLSTTEVAKLFNRSVKTIARWCDEDYLRAHRVAEGKQWQIDPEHVREKLSMRGRYVHRRVKVDTTDNNVNKPHETT